MPQSIFNENEVRKKFFKFYKSLIQKNIFAIEKKTCFRIKFPAVNFITRNISEIHLNFQYKNSYHTQTSHMLSLK